MMSIIKQTLAGVLLLSLSHTAAFSQSDPDRLTEADVAYQDKFIEAKGYLIMDRPDKAESLLTELYKEDKTNASVALELVDLYTKLNDADRKYKYAKVAANNAEGNLHYIHKYGEVCLEVGDYAEAVTAFEKLVKTDPSSEEYTDQLAKAYLQLGDRAKAVTAYNNLEKVIGISQNVSRRKFEIYDLADDKQSALRELKNLAAAMPDNLSALHTLASYHKKLGNTAEATNVYKQILEVDLNDTKANIELMGSAEKPENESNYLRALAPIIENQSLSVDNKALELIPYIQKLATSPDEDLGSALTELGHRLVAAHPTEAKSHALLGDVLYLTGNTGDAIKKYERTLELDDSVYSVWEQLMYAYLTTGDMDALAKTTEEAVDLFPNKASAYYLYGKSLRNAKKYDDAIDYLSDGILVAGRDVQAKSDIMAELAVTYQLAGSIDKASSSIEKALQLTNNANPTVLEAHGDVLALQGDTAAALKAWTAAKQAGASSTSLTRKISEKQFSE